MSERPTGARALPVGRYVHLAIQAGGQGSEHRRGKAPHLQSTAPDFYAVQRDREMDMAVGLEFRQSRAILDKMG